MVTKAMMEYQDLCEHLRTMLTEKVRVMKKVMSRDISTGDLKELAEILKKLTDIDPSFKKKEPAAPEKTEKEKAEEKVFQMAVDRMMKESVPEADTKVLDDYSKMTERISEREKTGKEAKEEL